MNIEKILLSENAILIRGFKPVNENESLLLHSPEQVLTAQSDSDVQNLISLIEKNQSEGKYAVGFFTYEMSSAFDLAVKEKIKSKFPLAWVAIYNAENVNPLSNKELNSLIKADISNPSDISLNITKQKYEEAVEEIKKLISSGDTYQVNFTCKSKIKSDIDSLNYFLTLTKSHPVPYAAYINCEYGKILSISPELFLNKTGNLLTTKPMKGTMRRGYLLEDDLEIADELKNSTKNRAENVMIADMMRNDLGRICEFGSVETKELFAVEKYRSLFQMTSTVIGELRKDVSLYEIFKATFPASSITGAPKHRTMEIIKSLEKEERAVYTGSIGLFTPSGDFTMNVAIRTLLQQKEGEYELGIGSGIVWDSQPDKEFNETLLKSSFAVNPLPDFKLIETLLLDQNKKYTYLDQHLQRLENSAQYWDFPFDKKMIINQLNDFKNKISQTPVIIRMALDSAGDIEITSREFIAQKSPVVLLLSDDKTDSQDRFLFHKTTNRSLYDNAYKQARESGYFDMLFTNEKGNITETSIANIFFRKGEQWFTPPITDGLLPGVWRSEFLKKENVLERSISINNLDSYDEIIIANSVRGIIEVEKIVDSKNKNIWGNNLIN